MGNTAALLLSLLVLSYGVSIGYGFYKEEREWEEERSSPSEEGFLLQDSKHVIRTDAGDVRVVRSYGGRIIDKPLLIGFITMEPKTLFIPQYMDSSLIIFIRRGEARIGLIHKNELAERTMKIGDVYRIPAGSAFYLVNIGEGQRLHAICCIDPSEGLALGALQSFFIGGGTYPTSILAGFEPETLSTAFNVTVQEVEEIMSRQSDGPIVYLGDSRAPSLWNKFIKMNEEDKLYHLKKVMVFQDDEEKEENTSSLWSWRKLLNSVLGQENKKIRDKKGKSPDSFNIYKKTPDFRNNYGSSFALDESAYPPLKHSGIGVYLVNLTAGSMMAPHVNPRATEYGVVLRGTGVIQIVYPNGTQAMNARVAEGDVFMVPKFFPFCQIASRTGPFEFFGFTTSARKNRPQFLAGANSILTRLIGPELAAAFGSTEKKVRRFVGAQREAVILPSASAAPPDKMVKNMPEMITRFWDEK